MNNQLVLNINNGASPSCAARQEDTKCQSELSRLTLINYKVENIPKYVCLTVVIKITRNITKFVNFSSFDA